jgi:KaiC/GvpD/RAD55 family RecA-like ATPase
LALAVQPDSRTVGGKIMSAILEFNDNWEQRTLMLYMALKNQDSQERKVEEPMLFEGDSASAIPLKGKGTDTLIGNSFKVGTASMVAAKGGSGKTLLAIELARRGIRSGLFQSVCFLNLEHHNDSYFPYYQLALPEGGYHIVWQKDWQKYLDDERQKNESMAALLAAYTVENPVCKKVLEALRIKRRILKNSNAFQERPYKILMFCKLLQEIIDAGDDCIVVDALSELFSNNVSRDVVDAVVRIASQAGVTFLALHHLNSKGKIKGTEDMKNSFESVYTMKRIKGTNVDVVNELRVYVEKSRNNTNPEDDFIIKRIRVSVYEAAYEVIPETDDLPENELSGDNIQKRAESFFRSRGSNITIDREEVDSALKDIAKNKKSITNILKDIKGIEKADGKTWNHIHIL